MMSSHPLHLLRQWKPPIGLIVFCGCIIALLSFGPRSAMGLYQTPILDEKGWSFTSFGLAMAIQNLCWGIGQPFFGGLADKYGAWRVLAFGALLYAIGLYMMAYANSPLIFYLGAGVFVGLGVSAGSFSIILSVFARHIGVEKRSLVFGLGTAAGSAGMFLFAPLTVSLIKNLGWSSSLLFCAALMLIVPILAIPLLGNAHDTKNSTAYQQTQSQALKEALHHKGYLLLTAGFFVCGFQVAFITAHFPAYIKDIGIDAAYAGYALGLIGFFNIFGAFASGIIGQKYPKPQFLSLIYILRSIAVTAFLLLPQSPTSVIIFSAIMGILWLSTVPPTNGLVAVMFGTAHLGLLGGIVFFFHQLGSFLGVFFGGYLRQIYGSFDTIWWLGVALGIFAALVHYPIQEKPVERPDHARS